MTTEIQLGLAQVVIGIIALFFAPLFATIWKSIAESRFYGLHISAHPLTGNELRSLEWMVYVNVNEKLKSGMRLEIFSNSSCNKVSNISEIRLIGDQVFGNIFQGVGNIRVDRILPGETVKFFLSFVRPGHPKAFVDRLEIPIFVNYVEMFRRNGEHFEEFQERLLIIAKWRLLWVVSAFSIISVISIARILYLGVQL